MVEKKIYGLLFSKGGVVLEKYETLKEAKDSLRTLMEEGSLDSAFVFGKFLLKAENKRVISFTKEFE